MEMHEQSLKDDILSERHDSKPVLVIFTLPEYNGCNSKSLCEGKVISDVTVVYSRRSIEIHCVRIAWGTLNGMEKALDRLILFAQKYS